ncbi:MAG: hypothetical protein EBR40_11405 [Proteobacteria bacterium]|nr:hypothetical protein [Pseudomonadota bacterium]
MATQASDFQSLSRRYTADKGFRSFIQKGLSGYYQKRDQNKANFQDWQGARDLAAEIKYEAVNHLDKYLLEFEEKITAIFNRKKPAA